MPNLDAEVKMNGESGVKAEGDLMVGLQPGVWQYRKTLKINQKMANVVNLTIDAARAEIKTLRRKVDKLTYGS
jgi:hypothetical protein